VSELVAPSAPDAALGRVIVIIRVARSHLIVTAEPYDAPIRRPRE
jgi:hypothetical protein